MDDMKKQQATKFRKKPVVIEARQFNNDASGYEVLNWINEGQHAAGRRFAEWRNHLLIVPTLEGEHIASPGDWIIKGVAGEFYPCKPDIFAATYEPAALSNAAPAAGEVVDGLSDALAEFDHTLSQWARAYPESVFPEPDLTLVRTALEARGITIDCVSASNMRHVVKTLNNEFNKVRAALTPASTPEGDGEAKRDWCTDPDNCQRCKAPEWDQNKYEHAGIPQGTQK